MARTARLALEVDGSGAKRGASEADRELQKLKQSATETEREMQNLSKSSGSTGNGLRQAAAGVKSLAAEMGTLNRASAATVAANQRVGASMEQMRAGSQQLSYQISDVTMAFATGVNPMVIFAQQGGQVVQALSMMKGGASGLLGFLGSPWGAVFMGAVSIVGMLTSSLFKSEDQMGKTGSATDNLLDKLDLGKNSYESLIDVVKEYNNAQQKSEVLAYAAADAAYRLADAKTKEAKATLAAVKASDPVSFGAMGISGTAIGSTAKMIAVSTLEKQINSLEKEKASAGTALGTERSKRATDKRYDVEQRYGQLILGVDEKRKRNLIDQNTYEKQRIKLLNEQKSAIDKIQESERKSRDTRKSEERSSKQVLADFEKQLRARGVSVISDSRSAAEQNSLYRRGLTPLDGYKNLSRHQSDQAVDVDKRTHNDQLAREAAQAAGLKGFKIVTESGGRKHYEWNGAGKPGEVDVAGSERAARDAAEELRQALVSLAKEFGNAKDAQERYVDATSKIKSAYDAKQISSDQYFEYNANALRQFNKDSAAEFERSLRETVADLSPMMQDAFEKPLDTVSSDFKDTMEEAGFGAAKSFRDEGLSAAQAIAQIIGGKSGGAIGKIFGVLDGLSTGNFNSVGGRAGGILTLFDSFSGGMLSNPKTDKDGKAISTPFMDGLRGVFDEHQLFLKTLFEKVFGPEGVISKLPKSLGEVLGNALLGSQLGGLTGSRAGGAIGGALGGVIGKGLTKSITKTLGDDFGKLAGPIGSIVGGLVGGAIGGLFKKTPKGSTTISSVDGALSYTGSGKLRDNVMSLGGSVQSSLQSIIDQLGGEAGGFSVSIGQRKKKFTVDPTGQGRTKGSGVLSFADEEAATRAAIADAIRDGAVKGIRDGARRLLEAGQDLDKQLAKAVKFNNVFRDLKARLDPVGAAVDDLNTEFENLKDIFGQAQASTAEYADLEKLYQLKRKDIIEQGNNSALQSMRDYLNELKGSTSSILSPELRYLNSNAEFERLLGLKASGSNVDFSTFRTASDDLLAAARDYKGSTTAFFRDDFQRVTNTVEQWLSADTLRAQTALPSVDFAPVTSAIVDQTNVTTALLQQISARLGELNLSGVSTAATPSYLTAANYLASAQTYYGAA